MLSGTMRLALIAELIEWVRPFFETFGYVIISVAMFFESAVFTGIVVPGDLILAIGGVYAGQEARWRVSSPAAPSSACSARRSAT